MSILLKNGVIISEFGVIKNGYLFIEGGRIISCGSGDCSLYAEKIIDVNRKIIAPGLIDVHTNGILDINFAESNVADLKRSFKEYIKYGVTNFLATIISNPIENILKQVKRIRQAKNESILGDVIYGVHMEGPWLNVRCKGGHNEKYIIPIMKKDVKKVIAEIGDIVKTITFAPEIDNSLWLCKILSNNYIIPVIGHTAANYEQTQKVIASGARHVTHLFDATLGFHESRKEALVMEPGMETSVLINDSVSVELIGCPVHVPKPFFKLVNKIKPYDKKIVVTDSLVGAGLPDGEVIRFMDGRQAKVKGGVLRLIDKNDRSLNGNLTGSAITMNVAVKNLSEYANITTEESIKWATINPARMLGISNETGSIRVGKKADIIVIDEGFDVKMTILNGNIVYHKNIS